MSVTEPPLREGAAFTDARSCREWLGALPMTNIPNAQYQVLSAMRALAANEGFDALERLKCLELVREKVAYLQREQRSQRESWLAELELEGRDEALFEFEVLLKAAACFSITERFRTTR